MRSLANLTLALVMGAAVLPACGRTPTPSEETYTVDIHPDEFVKVVVNPFFPLTPGSVYVYESHVDEGTERIRVEVLSETRQVFEITATVVHDTVTLEDVLIEDTYDWYAQDEDGNVWYLGEDVSNYEDGQFVDKSGSWEAGIDGALPGIIMFGDPASHLGETYRQEYYAGHAEDMAELVSLTAAVSVPFGSFTNALQTRDYTPLEPGVVEEKYYVAGIGAVKAVNPATGEEEVLVEFHAP